jgi:hypothetical protein
MPDDDQVALRGNASADNYDTRMRSLGSRKLPGQGLAGPARRTLWAVRQAARRKLRQLTLRPGRHAEAEGRREELAIRYLSGDGIEIGALHRPLWTPPGARVRYVDNVSREQLLQAADGVYGNAKTVVTST